MLLTGSFYFHKLKYFCLGLLWQHQLQICKQLQLERCQKENQFCLCQTCRLADLASLVAQTWKNCSFVNYWSKSKFLFSQVFHLPHHSHQLKEPSVTTLENNSSQLTTICLTYKPKTYIRIFYSTAWNSSCKFEKKQRNCSWTATIKLIVNNFNAVVEPEKWGIWLSTFSHKWTNVYWASHHEVVNLEE